MAEKDFNNIGLKDVLQKAMTSLCWFIKIGKHMGSLTIKHFENVKFKDNNELVGIVNSDGEYLYIPRNQLELYATISSKILYKLAYNIEEDISLIVGVPDELNKEKNTFIEKITIVEKNIFMNEEEEIETQTLFPELKHGDFINLYGEVTRENKTSNSLGFKYKEHILTAYPQNGNIIPYKQMLFSYCQISGFIDRTDEYGRYEAKRPKIIFSDLIPANEQEQRSLDL